MSEILDIKVTPLDKMSLEEIQQMLTTYRNNLDTLVNQYPSIIKIWIQKLGLKRLSSVDVDSLNMAIIPELKRLVSSDLWPFSQSNGSLIDMNTLSIYPSDDNTEKLEFKAGSIYNCTIEYIKLSTTALHGISKRKDFHGGYLIDNRFDSGDLHSSSFLALEHQFATSPCNPNPKPFFKSTNLSKYIALASRPLLEKVSVLSYFAGGTELYKQVHEAQRIPFVDKSVTFFTAINVSNTGPYLSIRYSINTAELTEDELQRYTQFHTPCDIIRDSTLFYNAQKTLNLEKCVSSYNIPFDKNIFIENLNSNSNHPVFDMIRSCHWLSSKDSHTRSVAELIEHHFKINSPSRT